MSHSEKTNSSLSPRTSQLVCMHKLSEEPPPGILGKGGQVTVVAQKKVKIDHFRFLLPKIFH